MNVVASNIKRRRVQLRLSQRELASRANVSLDTVSRAELKKGDPSLGVLRVLSEALCCEPADLLNPDWDCPPPHESYEEVG